MPRVTALLFVAVLMVAGGCSGIGARAPPTTPTGTAPSASPTGPPTVTPATDLPCAGDDPEKGTELLSVGPVSDATARQVTAGKRADFRELTPERRAVFLAALARDCNLVQSTFRFHDDDRVEYVLYDGSWYFLRVSVV